MKGRFFTVGCSLALASLGTQNMRYMLILVIMGWLVCAQAAAAEALAVPEEVRTSINECKPSAPPEQVDEASEVTEIPTPLLQKSSSKPAIRHQRAKAWRSFVPGVIR